MVLHQQIPVFLQLIGSLYLFVHAHQQQDLLFVDVQVAGGSDLFGFLQQFQAGFIAFGSVFLCHACFHQNYVIVVRSHLVVYVLAKGLPNLSFELLTTAPSYLSGRVGILPDILNSLYIVFATLIIVLPLGVGSAVYLTEYARNKKIVSAIEYAAEALSGIPSIIYGLVGMLFFCQFMGLQTSLFAGALTLAIMNLPTIMRTTQESLKTVPNSYREGAFALGAGKWRVIRTVVLPGCVDGIVTGCILSVGRILGESAALLYTAGFAHVLNGFFEAMSGSGATLTVALYFYAKEEGAFDVAFAIASILMILTLAINLAATLAGKHFEKRRNA